MERNRRKVFTGVVVSDKMEKTITVAVERTAKHKLYNKPVKYTKKYACHDEEQVAKTGDLVKIMSTRPLSKNKNFRLVEVLKVKEIV